MPEAIVIAIAGAAFAASTAGAIVTAILGTVITVGLGFISRALAFESAGGDISAGFAAKAQRRTQTIRTSMPGKSVVVGEAKKGGAITFYESTGNNQYHHLVVTLGEGPVEKIDPVWLGEIPVYADQLDGNGLVTVGPFKDLVRIKTHLGDAAQAADADLVGETSVDANFRGRGIAYVYVRIDWDRDAFPNGLPNISALVKGYKFEDSRTAATAWTPNPALAIRGFWTNAGWETALATSKFDDTFTDAAANICEEFVTTKDVAHTVSNVDVANDLVEFADTRLAWQTGDRVQLTTAGTLPAGLAPATDYYVIVARPLKNDDRAIAVKLASSYADALTETPVTITDAGSGTHMTKKAEPRYTANGVIDLGAGIDSADTTEELLSAMAGRWTASAKITMFAGAYTAPAVTLDENDVIAPLKIQTKIPRRDRFNRLMGIFVSPLNDWQPSEYPLVKDTAAETADGRAILRKLDLPFTSRTATAQRLAKIDLKRMLFERSVESVYSLKALQLLAGETVAMDNTRRGWSGMPFDVTRWRLVPINDGAIGVAMQQRETSSTAFDWNSASEETAVPAVNQSSLPNPFMVPAPTGFSVTTDTFVTDNGTSIDRIRLTWTSPSDSLITVNGRIEVQSRRSETLIDEWLDIDRVALWDDGDMSWDPSFYVDGADVQAYITPAERGRLHDMRIRSVNHVGGTSAWQTVSDYRVGTTGEGATSSLDYGFFSVSHDTALDYGAFTDTPTTLLDYGDFT